MIAAVEDLNLILFNNDENSIQTDIDPEIMLEKLKQASLLLYASDKPAQETIEFLQGVEWTQEDFMNIESSGIAAFRHFGIGPYATQEEPAAEPVPEPEEAPEEEAQEYTESAPPKTEPKPKREGPSAYGTALALMGPDPEMPLHELYEQMKDHGFDLQQATGSIKTAHSIFRKVYRYLKDNGHIVQK